MTWSRRKHYNIKCKQSLNYPHNHWHPQTWQELMFYSPEGLDDVRCGCGSICVGLPCQCDRGTCDIGHLGLGGWTGDQIWVCGSARLDRRSKLWKNHTQFQTYSKPGHRFQISAFPGRALLLYKIAKLSCREIPVCVNSNTKNAKCQRFLSAQ